MPKQKELKHWSYSAWSTWKKCAFKFYRTRIMGDKEPYHPAMARGTMIHSKAENYLKGKIQGIPTELVKLHPHYVALAKLNPIVEQYWGVTQDWDRADGKEASWCVMKMDAAVEPCRETDHRLFIQDLKTGKEYGDHSNQASLYASIGATRYPQAQHRGVEVEFWYADLGYSQPYIFTPGRIRKDTEMWQEQGDKMMSDTEFLPNPSPDNCKWCFLRSDKGGRCNAWKANRMN